MSSSEQFLTKKYEKWNNFQVRIFIPFILNIVW